MQYLSILLVFAVAAAVAGALLFIPSLIAPRRLTVVKAQPFECGKDPIEVAEGRFAIKFSTIAIFFIIIDIELLFIWPWAMLYRRLLRQLRHRAGHRHHNPGGRLHSRLPAAAGIRAGWAHEAAGQDRRPD